MATIGSSVVIIKWYLMTLTPHLILNDDDDEERYQPSNKFINETIHRRHVVACDWKLIRKKVIAI